MMEKAGELINNAERMGSIKKNVYMSSALINFGISNTGYMNVTRQLLAYV